jgi:hypothetical protein
MPQLSVWTIFNDESRIGVWQRFYDCL